MKIISLLSMLMTMASTSLLAMDGLEEKDNVSKAFTHYVSKSTLTPQNLLHEMQSKDFVSGPYTFHCWHQGIYLRNLNLEPLYPRYEPIGIPQIENVSTMPPTQHIALKWLIKDNPTPGFNTFSSMVFSYEVNGEVNNSPFSHDKNTKSNITIKEEVYRKNEIVSVVLKEQVPSLKVGTHSLNPEQMTRMQRYISEAGYDGTNFNFHTFAQWYGKKFIGYEEGGNIGFTSSRHPVVFNVLYGESYTSYLNLVKGLYVHLPFSKGICSEIERDSERLFKEIFSILPQASLRSENDVREKLIIKDGLIYDQNNQIRTFKDKIYGVDKKGDIYVQGKNCGNHPELLKGKWGLCAGHVSIDEGKIVFISNNSGHTMPHIYHLYSLLESLDKVLLSPDLIVEYYVKQEIGWDTKQVSLEQFLALNKDALRVEWEEEIQRRIEDNPFFKRIVSEVTKAPE